MQTETKTVRAKVARDAYKVGEYVPDCYTAIRYLSLNETLKLILESGRN